MPASKMTCPGCKQPFEIPETAASIVCPHCQKSFKRKVTPGSSGSSDSARPAQPSELKTLGRFQIQKKLGSGAFGTVYLAHDPKIRRSVALKVPNPGTLTTPKRVERFLREARAAANLRHPNIVPIYEAGQIDGQYYIASAFIAGQNLATVAADAESGLPFRQAAEVVRQLAEAVSYAHEQGIVHRDIKPANVMLDEAGRPHLMDFGLASRADEAEKLTTDGALLGTPAYMSPEQARGKPEASSDQYSLGVVLYDLLTGQTPFEGPPAVVIGQVLNVEPPSPRTFRPSIPRDLETIVLKCLKKEARERYAGCGQLADDLGRWLEGEPIRAREQRLWEKVQYWARRSALAASLVACLLLVMVLCGSLVSYAAGNARLQNSRADAERARADGAEKQVAETQNRLEQEVLRLSQETTRTNVAQQFVTHAESRLIEANKRLDSAHAVAKMDAARVEAARLEAAREETARTETARIEAARIEAEKKKRSPKFGSELFTVKGHINSVNHVAFSPDGKRILTGNLEASDKTAKVWDAEKGSVLLELKGHSSPVTSVNFSPDGKRIITGSRGFDQPGEAKVWDAKTGTLLLELKGHARDVTSVNFSPDGKRILTGSLDKTAKVWDAENGTELKTFQGHTTLVISASFSADGTRIITEGRQSNKLGESMVWDTESGTQILAIKGGGFRERGAKFSPDGKRILTDSSNTTAKVYDAEKGTELIVLKGTYGPMEFSPDGKRIFTRSGAASAKVWDAENGTEVFRLFHNGEVTSVAFSSDGKRILTGSSDRTAKVWDAEKGTEILTLKLHTGSVTSVAFSPNGMRVLTGSFGGSDKQGKLIPGEAKVWDAEKGTEILTLKLHTGSVTSVAFSPDGKRVLTGSGDTAKVWDIDEGLPELPTVAGPKVRSGWQVFPTVDHLPRAAIDLFDKDNPKVGSEKDAVVRTIRKGVYTISNPGMGWWAWNHATLPDQYAMEVVGRVASGDGEWLIVLT